MYSLIYASIDYSIGTDVAVGLGIGQAVILIYFNLGRGSFVYHN